MTVGTEELAAYAGVTDEDLNTGFAACGEVGRDRRASGGERGFGSDIGLNGDKVSSATLSWVGEESVEGGNGGIEEGFSSTKDVYERTVGG